jgi:hypothetical protein
MVEQQLMTRENLEKRPVFDETGEMNEWGR